MKMLVSYLLADVVCDVLTVGATVLLLRVLVIATCTDGVAVHAAVLGHISVTACCAEKNSVVVGDQPEAGLIVCCDGLNVI